MDNETEMTRLVLRAKVLREKMEDDSILPPELYELYGIYSILIRFHQPAKAGH